MTTSTALNDYVDWPGVQQVFCLERLFTDTALLVAQIIVALAIAVPVALVAAGFVMRAAERGTPSAWANRLA